MHYALLIYTKPGIVESLSPAEREALSREYDGHDGQDLILLADQDRSRWDWPQIAEGRAILSGITARGGSGPYTLQASIASLQFADEIGVLALDPRRTALPPRSRSAVGAIVAVAGGCHTIPR
jgi:hypothetical protein